MLACPVFIYLVGQISKFPQYKQISTEELRPGTAGGFSFTSACINPAIYLPWLVSQCLERKVVFKRSSFKHISEAAKVHHSGQKADLIINCTGLNAGKLGGVADPNMIPVRGQTVLVRNDSGGDFVLENAEGSDEVCYIMRRAAGKTPQVRVCRGARQAELLQAVGHSSEAPSNVATGIPKSTRIWPTGS